MSDRDDERMLSLVRGELEGEALDELLNDTERDPDMARRFTQWQRLAALAVDEHVQSTRESAFAAFQSRLEQAEAQQTAGGVNAQALGGAIRPTLSTQKVRDAGSRVPRSPGGGLDRLLAGWSRWLFGDSGGVRPALAVVALAVVLGQGGVIAWILHDRELAQGGSSLVYRGGGNPCEQSVVWLAPGATVDALVQWLGLHNATLQGPDESGRFTLVASDPAALRALLADPQAQALIAARQPAPAACDAGH